MISDTRARAEAARKAWEKADPQRFMRSDFGGPTALDRAREYIAELEAEVARLANALQLIADGRWNVGKQQWYDARIFAAKTLAARAEEGSRDE